MSPEAGAGGDTGPRADAGVPEFDPLSPFPERDNGEGDDDVRSCFDTADNDATADGAFDGIDCDDPDCYTRVRACAVGRDDFCASSPPTDLDVPGTFLPFGSPGPSVDFGLSPNGDGQYDSGWISPDTVDLRARRVTLTAQLVFPETCASCLEQVAIGFTSQAALGDMDTVRPLVALLATAPLDQVLLLAGDRVVAQFEGGTAEWSLTVAPSGVVSVTRDGEPQSVSVQVAPQRSARVVVYGHNTNPPGSDPGVPPDRARVDAPRLESSLCDMPRAWGPRTSLVGGDELPLSGDAPSLARLGAVTFLAYATDEGITITARGDEVAPTRFGAAVANVVIAAARPTAPELLADGEDLVLYFAEDGGVRRAAPATSFLSSAPMYDPPTEVVGPALLRGAESVTGPSIAHSPSTAPERLVMSVRAIEASGRSRIWLLSSQDGITWVPRGILPDLVAADSLGDPALFVHDGAFQLYLPYRRGTRWRLAHLASPNLADWRLVAADALEGMGPPERLGVGDPDVHVVADTIELVYVGLDGVAEHLRRTTRMTTGAAELPTR